MREPAKIYFASSNSGKLAEFRALAIRHAAAGMAPVSVEPLPGFDSIPAFAENTPTFGENALGKALYYSQLTSGLNSGFLFADDSGLVVPALEGRPGVHSARYAGPHATSAERIAKLLEELGGKPGAERGSYFCCVIAVVKDGRPIAIVSNRADGEILAAPRGTGGFGYDPIFYFPALRQTFAELSSEEKNEQSHRGKAFRRVLALLQSLQQ